MRSYIRALPLLPALAAFALPACADEELVSIPREEPEPEPEEDEDPPPPPPPADEEPVPPPSSGDECTSDSDCAGDTECEQGVCVGIGELQVTLTFDPDADLDLHVITPSGEEIYFGNTSAAGGVLDVDTCITSCGPGPHVENVFFNTALQSGLYQAFAINYDGRDGGQFRVEVSGAATTQMTGFIAAVADERTQDLLWVIED